jgi:hypothetical protein
MCRAPEPIPAFAGQGLEKILQPEREAQALPPMGTEISSTWDS